MGQAAGTPAVQQARTRVPWTMIAVTFLVAATLVAVVLLAAYAGPWLEPPDRVAVVIAVAALQLTLAVVVAKAAPGDVTGPLLASLGLILVVTNCVRTEEVGIFEGTWMLLYLPLALVLIVVPGGRPASGLWRVVTAVLCGVVGTFVVGNAVRSTVAPESNELTVVGFVLLSLFFVLVVACAFAPFARYRRAGALERIRLRWVLVSGLSLPLTLLLCWASYLAFGTPDLVGIGLLVMFLAIPAGAAIALTRPQLFDVDRVTVSAVTALVLLAVALTGLSVAGAAAGTGMDEWPAVTAAVTAASTALACVVAFPFARRGSTGCCIRNAHAALPSCGGYPGASMPGRKGQRASKTCCGRVCATRVSSSPTGGSQTTPSSGSTGSWWRRARLSRPCVPAVRRSVRSCRLPRGPNGRPRRSPGRRPHCSMR